MARTGFEDLTGSDYDIVELHNLDRLLYATHHDIGKEKVTLLAEHLASRATAQPLPALRLTTILAKGMFARR